MTTIPNTNWVSSTPVRLPGNISAQKEQSTAFKAGLAEISVGASGYSSSLPSPPHQNPGTFEQASLHSGQHLPGKDEAGRVLTLGSDFLLAADESAPSANHPNIIHAKEVDIEEMAKVALGDDFQIKRLVVWNTLPIIMRFQQKALESAFGQRGVEVIVLAPSELAEASQYFDQNTVFMPLFSYDKERSAILTEIGGIPTSNGVQEYPDIIMRWSDVISSADKPGLVLLCGCNTDSVLTPLDERISLGETLSQQAQLPVIGFHGLVEVSKQGKIARPFYAASGRTDAYLYTPDAPRSRISRLKLKESERSVQAQPLVYTFPIPNAEPNQVAATNVESKGSEQPTAMSSAAQPNSEPNGPAVVEPQSAVTVPTFSQTQAQGQQRFSEFDALTRSNGYQQLTPQQQYEASANHFGFAGDTNMSVFEAIRGHMNIHGSAFVADPDALVAEIQALQPEDASDALSEMYYTFLHEPHLVNGSPDNAADITNVNSLVTVNMDPRRLSDLSNVTQVLNTVIDEWNTMAVGHIEDPDLRLLNAFLRGDNVTSKNLAGVWRSNLLGMGVFHSKTDQQAYGKFINLYENAVSLMQSDVPAEQAQGQAELDQARVVMRGIIARNYKNVTPEELQQEYRWGEAIRRASGADLVYRETAHQWLQASSPDLQTVTDITLRLWQWAEQTDMPHPQKVEDIYQAIVQNNEYSLNEFINATAQANLTYALIRGDISAVDYIRQRLPAESLQGLNDGQLLGQETLQTVKLWTAPSMDSASSGTDTQTPDPGPQGHFNTVERLGSSPNADSFFSTTPVLRLDPNLNPNGLIGNDGSQAGHNGGKDGNGANTAVAAPGEDNPFSNSIPDQVPLNLAGRMGQLHIPERVPEWMNLPVDPDRPEAPASPSTDTVEGTSLSGTPHNESGGVSIGGQLGSPGEAEKANAEMEQLLGKGSRQGVRPDLFPTPIDNRIPGFGEGVPPADAGSNDTRWGLPNEPIRLPQSESFPEQDPVLEGILNPNGKGRPQFTFPPIKEGSRIPEIPAGTKAAVIKAFPELQEITYGQFTQLSAQDQQQIIPRTQAYQQLAPNDKTNISLIDYLDSSKTSPTQRQQLSGLNAQQAVYQARLNAIAANTGLSNSAIELINTRITALQAGTVQINQNTQALQQGNAQGQSERALRLKTDPVGGAFIKPEPSLPQANITTRQSTEIASAIPRFMVVRSESGPKLVENLPNGQTRLHFYPLVANTPITQQESNGAWSNVPDVGEIGSKLFIDLLFTQGALKMLNQGKPVQLPDAQSTPQSVPISQPSL